MHNLLRVPAGPLKTRLRPACSRPGWAWRGPPQDSADNRPIISLACDSERHLPVPGGSWKEEIAAGVVKCWPAAESIGRSTFGSATMKNVAMGPRSSDSSRFQPVERRLSHAFVISKSLASWSSAEYIDATGKRILPRPRPSVPEAKHRQATSPRHSHGLPGVRS